jgi:hypothetical protein
MRRLFGLLTVAVFAASLVACGESSHGKAATTAPPPNFSTRHNDRDNDGDHNDDDGKVLYFGHAADAADRENSIALVTRYFTAAAGGDGAAGCSMLAPFIAESVAENDGQAPPLLGKTCPVVLGKLFKLHHQLLDEKHATLRVIGVRVEGDRALVILDFPTIPEVRQMPERRIGGRWWLLDLLDGILE